MGCRFLPVTFPSRTSNLLGWDLCRSTAALPRPPPGSYPPSCEADAHLMEQAKCFINEPRGAATSVLELYQVRHSRGHMAPHHTPRTSSRAHGHVPYPMATYRIPCLLTLFYWGRPGSNPALKGASFIYRPTAESMRGSFSHRKRQKHQGAHAPLAPL
jgi:hypothetical protein